MKKTPPSEIIIQESPYLPTFDQQVEIVERELEPMRLIIGDRAAIGVGKKSIL